jgi:hypothetical protein
MGAMASLTCYFRAGTTYCNYICTKLQASILGRVDIHRIHSMHAATATKDA